MDSIRHLRFLPFLVLFLLWSCSKESNETNTTKTLEKVLANLNQIETAKYISTRAAYNAYDTVLPVYKSNHYIKEYINPQDTFVGASYVRLSYGDTSKMEFSYDGAMRSRVQWEKGFIEIDSFKTMRFPYRPVNTPFFTRAKAILNYITNTADSISYPIKYNENSFKISLTILDSVNTVDFMIGGAKPLYNPEQPEYYDFGFSRYDIWVRKTDFLPFKIKRDLPHNISTERIQKVTLNDDHLSNFSARSYFPDLPFPDKSKKQENELNLLDQEAPRWALEGTENKVVSLDDFKGKLILLEFTGIGCGPCHAALPYLKKLSKRFDEGSFEIVSIECWSQDLEAIRRYQDKYELDYKILKSDKTIEKQYAIDGVPQFFLIDRDQVIKAKFSGYLTDGSVDRKIDDTIINLMKGLYE